MMESVKRVYIVVTVPKEGLGAVLDAIASAGGGEIGEYTHCSYSSSGIGRFKPSDEANPHVGEKGEINRIEEWRVETFAPRDRAKAVVQAIRAAHPYEEPVIYVVPLLDEDEL
jgi:hypothetical protein